jgi:hypothetical protein
MHLHQKLVCCWRSRGHYWVPTGASEAPLQKKTLLSWRASPENRTYGGQFRGLYQARRPSASRTSHAPQPGAHLQGRTYDWGRLEHRKRRFSPSINVDQRPFRAQPDIAAVLLRVGRPPVARGVSMSEWFTGFAIVFLFNSRQSVINQAMSCGVCACSLTSPLTFSPTVSFPDRAARRPWTALGALRLCGTIDSPRHCDK